MNVGFFFGWHVVIKDMGHLIHVDATGCDIRGDKNWRLGAFEFFQNSLTPVLAFIGMNRLRAKSSLIQMPDNPVSSMFGTAEDDCSGGCHSLD
jgi:hypothetical protein